MTDPVEPTVALVPIEGRVYSAPHLVRVDARTTQSTTYPPPTDAISS